MPYILQSTAEPTRYYNGSTLSKRGFTYALFSAITNARNFDTQEEAIETSETFEVPVNVVEV
jgi:hypothetical protein